MKRILVIAAHPDDEILGVGGTIAKHHAQGDHCYAVILGEGVSSRVDVENTVVAEEQKKLYKAMNDACKMVGYESVECMGLPDNSFDKLTLLSITQKVEAIVDKYAPDTIYTHYGDDLNIDHQYTYQAVVTATRPMPGTKKVDLYTFETLSSTEWSAKNNRFSPQRFVDVTEYIDVKVKALEYYEMEMREYPHPRSLEGVKILAQYRGLEVGQLFTEAFEVVREIR